jgi:hypothetical protein
VYGGRPDEDGLPELGSAYWDRKRQTSYLPLPLMCTQYAMLPEPLAAWGVAGGRGRGAAETVVSIPASSAKLVALNVQYSI